MLCGNRFSLLLLLFILFNLLYFSAGLKCSKGGLCNSLKTVNIAADMDLSKRGETECDVCVQFRCIVNGKHVMIGAGCPDEFQKYCNASECDMKIFNEKGDQYYWNNNLLFVKCTDRDHCADDFMNEIASKKVNISGFGSEYNKALGENCDYEEKTSTATSSTTNPGGLLNDHKNGNETNSYQNRGFQIYGAFIFALILVYLW